MIVTVLGCCFEFYKILEIGLTRIEAFMQKLQKIQISEKNKKKGNKKRRRKETDRAAQPSQLARPNLLNRNGIFFPHFFP
jgi:transposase